MDSSSNAGSSHGSAPRISSSVVTLLQSEPTIVDDSKPSSLYEGTFYFGILIYSHFKHSIIFAFSKLH